jgi:hypothetical protein
MKPTLFASLVSGLSRIFKPAKPSQYRRDGRQIITGKNGEILYDSWAPIIPESDRPLEQIINEGSHGVIETVPAVPELIIEPSQKDKDIQYIAKNFNIQRDILVLSPARAQSLLVNEDDLNSLPDNVILIPGCLNIGIVKSH